MEPQAISGFYTSNEQLPSNKVRSLHSDKPLAFYLETGEADVFYMEKLPTGPGRRLFLFRITAPFLLPAFLTNDSITLVLSALNASTLGILDPGSMNRLLSENPDYARFLIDKWSIGISEALDNLGILSQLNGEISVTSFMAELLKKYSGSNEQLLSYWFSFNNERIVPVLRKLCTEDQKISLEHVKDTYAFRKNSVYNALSRFKSIISGKTTDDLFGDERRASSNIDAAVNPRMLLLQTCKLIGKEERIEFADPGNRISGKHDFLWNLLRASNIRSRMVTLDPHWWTSNAGSMLGFLKDGQTPVALLSKGTTGYWMVDLKNRKKEVVHESVNRLLDTKAYSFFTPFPKGKLNGKDLFRFALQFTYRDIISFMVIGIIGALLALLIPIVGGYVFNTVIPGGNTHELWQIGGIMVICVITIGLLNFAKSIAVLRMAGKAGYKLQSALWDRILSLKVDFFRNYSPGNLAERSMGIERIRDTLSTTVLGAMISGIFSVFYLALLFFYDLKLALLALVLGLVVAGFTLTISLLAYKHVVFMRRMDAMISGFLLMAIRGINKIRVTGSKEKVFSLWAERYSQQKDHYRQKRVLLMVAEIFTVTFPVLASMLIFIRVYSIFRSGLPGFGIGDFVAFNSAYLSFQGALIQTFMVTVPLLNIKPTYQLFQPILEADTEDMNEKLDPGELSGSIEITQLSFKYPDSPDWSLKDINLTIHPGQFVAFTGSSGSGKSTLIRLLLGFENYHVGSILFDNKELDGLDIRGVRDQLGVVLQNSRIMQGTVLYNITGSSLYTEDDAWKAAELAGCADEINNLPNKMYTILPPGGDTLSGGQQQRIIIARALIRNPRILIFDEATSALDNETQQIVSFSVEKMKATRIVIAHRLSTIINADRIFVLDKGQLIEEGTYQELLDKNGFFAELTKRQLA